MGGGWGAEPPHTFHFSFFSIFLCLPPSFVSAYTLKPNLDTVIKPSLTVPASCQITISITITVNMQAGAAWPDVQPVSYIILTIHVKGIGGKSARLLLLTKLEWNGDADRWEHAVGWERRIWIICCSRHQFILPKLDRLRRIVSVLDEPRPATRQLPAMRSVMTLNLHESSYFICYNLCVA